MCSKNLCWNTIESRRCSARHWSGAATVIAIAAAGVTAFAMPVGAAEQAAKTGKAAATKTEDAGGRVFSKTRPLFKDQIPEVTPGPDGATKAEVITGPEPDKAQKPKAGKAKTATKAPAQGSGQAKPVVIKAAPTQKSEPAVAKPASSVKIINKASADERVETKPKESPAAKSSKATTKPDLAAKPTEKPGKAEPSTASKPTAEQRVVLPVRKPVVPVARRITSALAAANAKVNDKDRVQTAKRQPAKARRRSAPPSAYSPGAPRPLPRTARNRHGHDEPPVERSRRREDRGPDWRRGAPPGAIDSFVRCRRGEGCVRYYRVRRPRNFREFRRLRRWERWRQRWSRAARYRAWRRLYPDHYHH